MGILLSLVFCRVNYFETDTPGVIDCRCRLQQVYVTTIE
jgi:hypothetical protein